MDNPEAKKTKSSSRFSFKAPPSPAFSIVLQSLEPNQYVKVFCSKRCKRLCGYKNALQWFSVSEPKHDHDLPSYTDSSVRHLENLVALREDPAMAQGHCAKENNTDVHWSMSDLVVFNATNQFGTFELSMRIDNDDHIVNYRTKALYDRLIGEFLFAETRGLFKSPRADGKRRRKWRCRFCGRLDFSAKHRLNWHRWVQGCSAVLSYGEQAVRLLPYPDLKSGQGKTGEQYRKVGTLT